MEESKENVYERICRTRKNGRATALDYINGFLDGFIEFHGDRYYADDHAIVGGIGRLCGIPVTAIGIEKGRTPAERFDRRFGSPLPEGYRKALRLMKQAEKFHRPVICFVDTQGAGCGKEAEERGVGEAIARNLYELSSLKTPVLSIVIGEGGSGGALALAVADSVWMLENAYYSVITPESCASILFKDPSRAAEAAQALKLTAHDLKELGVIEKIIPEPEDFAEAARKWKFIVELRDEVAEEVKRLMAESTEDLLSERYEKYRKIGRYEIYSERIDPKKSKERKVFGFLKRA